MLPIAFVPITLTAWLVGYIFGTIIFSLAIITFFIKIFILPRLVRKLPEFIPTKKISDELITEIKTKLIELQRKRRDSHAHSQIQIETEGVESSIWLNGIINWFWMNLLDFPQIKRVLDRVISEMIVDMRRTPLGFVIINSELKSVTTAGSAPQISNMKILTGSSLSEPTSTAPLTLSFDILSSGGCLEIFFTLNFICNLSMEVRAIIKTFEASMCLVLQEQEFYLTFLKEPQNVDTAICLSFNTSSKSNLKPDHSYQIPLLNQILSRYLVRKGIAAGCCFPQFLGKWYRAGPDQPPYPWNPSVLENPALLHNWSEMNQK